MVILEDKNDASYQIRAYDTGMIKVNDTEYRQSLIIAPEHLIANWEPQSLTDIQAKHWQPILELQPEVVIIGTGDQFILPKPEILAPLYAQQLGVESMSTGAACRTYTALMADGRNVVAALLIQ